MPTFDTPEPISVNLEICVGDLRVVASDRADTVVDVQPSDPAKQSDVTAAEQTRVAYANGALQIKAPKGWRRYSFRGGHESIEVRIDLPTGSLLRGEAGVAGLQASGTLGECRYRTGAGDVAVEHVAGRSSSPPVLGPSGWTGSTARPRSGTPTATPGSVRSSAT